MLLIVAIFTTLIIRIFDLQIVNENYYMSTYIQKAEKTVYSPGTRGNIYDCKGNLLAYDTLAYVATFEDTIESDDNKNKKLNKIADKAIKIIEKCGDKIVVDFPIVKDRNGNLKYNFTSDTLALAFIPVIFITPSSISFKSPLTIPVSDVLANETDTLLSSSIIDLTFA